MLAPSLYPPNPANVPPEVTRLESGYRFRVVAMIASLFLFLLLYLLFLAVAGLLAYWLLALPVPQGGGRGILLFFVLKFGGAFAAALLGLFLFKGLFKGQTVDRSTYVPLVEADHPDLFAFIRRVYQDVGAPPPRRVYVSPEVNAALVYNTSLLNLFFPPRKDLLIGLGLVNVLPLAEFKAVLAHEFGHFAQRSVGLGSYVYVANRVMHDMIYGRDGLDRFVDQWSSQDVRISFPAWGLKGVLWVVRKILAALYQGLNLLHLSLGRQMEYNADNVAVSVAGSDAILQGLYRLDFASECLADAAHSLDAAADQALFTDDLFYHQAQAAKRLRRVRKDEQLGLPPPLPEDAHQQIQIFQPEDDGIPDHYRSHPTHYMREQNAKRYYVRSPQDDRSPWLLFGNLAAVKQEVTERFYHHVLDRQEPYEPRLAAQVQEFIDAEHAETTYDPKYHGLYDDRFLTPGDFDDLPDNPWPADHLSRWLAGWPGPDLQKQVESYHQRQSEYHLLNGLRSGEYSLKGETFPFRDQEYSARDVDRLFDKVDKELDQDLESFRRLDREVFLGHWSLARYLDANHASVSPQSPSPSESNGRGAGPRERELLERYRFQMAVQGLLQGMLGEQARLQAILNFLSGNSELGQEDFQQVRDGLAQVHETLTACLENARAISSPRLTNVPAGSSLYSLIIDRGDTASPPLYEGSISGEWLHKLINRLEGVLRRVKRVHFKSQGSLLTYQDQLACEWKLSPTAEVQPTCLSSCEK